MTYRDRLFSGYTEHVEYVDGDEASRREWFRAHAGHYLPYLPRDGKILEVGCGRGFLLAALDDAGIRDLTGIDLSPTDVELARVNAPAARVEIADAGSFIEREAWDAIVAKAVLEHVPKVDVLPFIECVARGLKPGGVAVFEVPNMGWLFAGHERYMDFTHEVGFTRESLRQVLGLAFSSVEVHPIEETPMRRRFGRRWIARRMLEWAEPQGASGPIWARSLLAVARAPR